MGTILMSANSSIANADANNTIDIEEISLGGVDVSSRKIPLIYRVEFFLRYSATPAAYTISKFGLLSDDSPTDIEPDDDDAVALGFVNIDESGGGFRLISPIIMDFPTPIAKATSKLYAAARSTTGGTYNFMVEARVFYEVKAVTSNVMVALLAN